LANRAAREIANQSRRILIMTTHRWDSAELAAAQEAVERFLRRRRQDPQVAARRAAAAAFLQRVGVPEWPLVYWTPDPEHPTTKVCSVCGEEKHFPEFYLYYKTGRLIGACRVCARARARRYYSEAPEKCRARARRRRRERSRCAETAEEDRETKRRWRREHREWMRERQRQYRQRHPRETHVREITYRLRKLGLLRLGERCEDCGGTPEHHHHPDYDDPFNVVTLCRRCHMARHWAEWRRRGGGPVKYPEEYGV
jgi:hypothetical protein